MQCIEFTSYSPHPQIYGLLHLKVHMIGHKLGKDNFKVTPLRFHHKHTYSIHQNVGFFCNFYVKYQITKLGNRVFKAQWNKSQSKYITASRSNEYDLKTHPCLHEIARRFRKSWAQICIMMLQTQNHIQRELYY